jgi:hypothetical protein
MYKMSPPWQQSDRRLDMYNEPHVMQFKKRMRLAFRVDGENCVLVDAAGKEFVPYRVDKRTVNQRRSEIGVTRRDFYFEYKGFYWHGFAINNSAVNCCEMNKRKDN